MHDLIQAVIDATGQREAASHMRREDMHTRACDRQQTAIEALEQVLAHERALAAGNATLSALNDDWAVLLQDKEAAIADLRDELAEARRPNVQRGKEAEELRKAIEALLAEGWAPGAAEVTDEEHEMETMVKHRLQRILDSVDARDAVAHLDAEAALARDRGIPDRAGRDEIRAAYDAVDRMETERNEWRERKEAADKVIAQTGERLNWSGLETVWEAAQRVAQERDTLRRQLASCRASERYLTEAIHQIPDLGEDEDYQVAVRRVLRDRDQWRAHAEDRDRGFAAEVRRRQEAEAAALGADLLRQRGVDPTGRIG